MYKRQDWYIYELGNGVRSGNWEEADKIVGMMNIFQQAKSKDVYKRQGDMYFHDATICFQNWQSCATCHPNDARMDGLNWDLLNDGMGNPKNTKTLLLSHQTPPCMATGIRKNAEVAVRSGVKYILFMEGNDEIYESIDELSLIHILCCAPSWKASL